MDINKRLSSANTLNDYLELTQELENIKENVKVVVNMSTILSLKKVRCLEIEYFNKCDGSGAAFILFGRLLTTPPVKTWRLLGPELISLIQYWLEAVRKHLISHHTNWWSFLRHLLHFIQQIRQKDQSLSNVLVELTSECLLDLSTSGKPDVYQRYEILYTFNLYCAEASREVRQTMKPKFEHYFIRLSAILATCGHVPCQLVALETLLRWLQPRRDLATRKEAADKWLLPHLYKRNVVELFLERNWMNFFQDARDFLNCHNESKDLVTSVVCRKLTVGDIVIVSGSERRDTWLDINSGSGLSVTLEPQLLELLAIVGATSCQTLHIDKDTATFVKLERESAQVIISLMLLAPPTILPSGVKALEDGECDVTIVISSRSDLFRVDRALRGLFQDKYQVLLDVETRISLSPVKNNQKRRNSIEEKSRFSHPDKPKRAAREGCITIRSRRIGNFRSPSTASTTSLAQLHDKLSNLPYYEFTKEPVSVCAQPDLSVVSETNESEFSHSLGSSTSTCKLSQNGIQLFRTRLGEQKSFSDGNVIKDIEEPVDNAKCSQSDNEVLKMNKKVVRYVFLATLGSTDESSVNDIIERMPKDKPIDTEDLRELLIQEALQAKSNEERLADSGIISGDPKKTQDSECIEDTQFVGLRNKNKKTPNNCKVVSKSTSDESNTEPVINTTNFVNVRKRNQRMKSVQKRVEDPNTFDVQAVEDFFSQHFAENQMGDVIVSPTLAKKINESSSQSSDDFLFEGINENDFNVEMPDVDVVECLNSIVDNVCIEFEKCAQYLDKEFPENDILNMASNINAQSVNKTPLKEIGNIEDQDKELSQTPKTRRGKPKPVIIKVKVGKKQKAPKKNKGKLKLEPVSKMSVILEDNNESEANKTNQSDSKKDSPDGEMPLIKRKRKLYSPKDDEINFNNDHEPEEVTVTKPNEDVQSDDEDVFVDNFKPTTVVTPENTLRRSVTPKSAATCYKEIEKDRQKYRRIRKNKNVQSPLSPKSKKMDEVFEHLKDDIETREQIILVDKKSDKDVAIFNFTSDSSDEEFKQKKTEVQLRTSTTTVASGMSIVSTRRGRPVNKVNYKEKGKSSSNETDPKPARRKRTTKRKNSKGKSKNVKVDPPNLIDERIRDAPQEKLNSSFTMIVDKCEKKNIEPVIQQPRLEAMPDENECTVTKKVSEEKKKRSTRKQGNKQQKTNIPPLEIIKDGETTASSLPGLIIEEEKHEKCGEDSVTTNLIQKIQNYYKDPDAYNDTNTTQNMIFDNDMGNSPVMNITEELGKMMDAETSKTNNPNNEEPNNYDSDANTIDDTMNSENETKNKAGSTKSNKSKRSRLRLKTKEKATKNNVNSKVESESKSKENKDDTMEINVSQKSKDSKVIKSSIEAVCIGTALVTRSKSNRSSIEAACIETTRVTRSKSKSLSRSREIVQIDLTEESDDESEKSIATEGINAHGDADESPPGSTLFNEKMTPRELQDMDQNIKDYYIELNNIVNVSKDSIEKSSEKAKVQKPDKRSATSSANNSQVNRTKLFDKGDYDISKWLPSVRDTDSDRSKTSPKSKSTTVSLKRLTPEEISKWIPSAKTTPNSSFESETPRKILRSRINTTRKSLISPIQLDFGPKSITFDTPASKETTNTQDTDTSRPNISKSIRFLRPTQQSSPISNSRESTPKSAQKRKSPENIKYEDSKKRKLNFDSVAPKVNLCQSSQSSNVEEWLKSLTSVNKVDNGDAISEVIQNIIERIDTTLVETNQNNSNNFISLYVEVQERLDDLKLERHRLHRQTVQEALQNLVTLVTEFLDHKFALMNQRMSEQDDAIMSWLRERTSEAVKKDCLQKKAMVTLLKEDLWAVAQHQANITRPDN